MKRLSTFMQRARRRWRHSEEGATAVEFALIAMVFFWLFIGIVELGMLMIFNNGLEDGVDRASRMIRTGQVVRQGLDRNAFKRNICSFVVLRTACDSRLLLDVRSFNDFSDIRNLQQPRQDSSGNWNLDEGYQTGGPRQVVMVRAFYNWKFFTPLIGMLMSNTGDGRTFLVTAATTFRNEPYGSDTP